jgi:bifunctional ADP-heptose synthase (sugar kinase/adenylyltransferase)
VERAELLAALDCVNAVVIFDDPTPADIVRLIRPHVLVKGADWAADAIVGRDTVDGNSAARSCAFRSSRGGRHLPLSKRSLATYPPQ